MPYVKKTIESGGIIEVSKYYTGRYGTKEAKREIAEHQPTPEEQKKWQEKNAVLELWRTIRHEENFRPGDWWATLTYPARTKPENETVRRNIRAWIKRAKRKYEKAGLELKYVFSVGRSKRGMAHLHILLSYCPNPQELAQDWQDIVNHGAWVHTNWQPIGKDRNEWRRIAEYLVKNSAEDFASGDPIYKKRYSPSRNLVRPKTKREISDAQKWRETPPEKTGYYIDKNHSYTAIEETHDGRMVKKQYTVYVRLNPKEAKTSDKGHGARQGHRICHESHGGRKKHQAAGRGQSQKAPPRPRPSRTKAKIDA